MEYVRWWVRRQKLIYDHPADPLLPYFSFFFPIPTPPPPPQKKKKKKTNHPLLSTTSHISWSFVVTASVFWFTDEFYQFL